jgi:hypothetical protein
MNKKKNPMNPLKAGRPSSFYPHHLPDAACIMIPLFSAVLSHQKEMKRRIPAVSAPLVSENRKVYIKLKKFFKESIPIRSIFCWKLL